MGAMARWKARGKARGPDGLWMFKHQMGVQHSSAIKNWKLPHRKPENIHKNMRFCIKNRVTIKKRRTQTNRLPLDPEFEPTFCGFRCSTFQSLDMSLMPILRSSKIICIENHKKSGTVSTEASVSMMVKLPMIR